LDHGICIAWYNLPDKTRDAYLEWLHGSYIPKQLERPGITWAAHYASASNVKLSGAKGRLSNVKDNSVPTGDRYILLLGGNDAHAFARPTQRDYHAQLPAADRKMLAMRLGERVNVMAEEARVHGPAAAQPLDKISLSPCIQIGSFNTGDQDDDDVMAWYAQWRMPCMEKLPGCVRVRKYASVSGWAKHAILYEFTSVEARNDNFLEHERPHPEQEAWSDKVVRKLVHAPGSPNLARRIWPA